MRKAILFLGLLLTAILASGSACAQSQYHWTDFHWPNGTPFCASPLGCPDLGSSCLSASNEWWPGAASEHLRLCTLDGPGAARAYVDAYCCGQLYVAYPKLYCDSDQQADINGARSGCIPRHPPNRDCRDSANSNASAGLCGNPVSLTSGNKRQVVVDFTTAGPNALTFTRTYNSQGEADTPLFAKPLGIKWQSNFDSYLLSNGSSSMTVYRSTGTTINFTLSGSTWMPPADMPVKLVQITNGWQFTGIDDTVETFDSSLRLTQIAGRNGYTQNLTYDGSGKLTTVRDSYSRTLRFSYTGPRVTTMVAADGTVYQYAYDKSLTPLQSDPDRLISVAYPAANAGGSGSNRTVTYQYENPDYPGYLTGITDEKGVRFATWTYDADGHAASSQHAGGTEAYAFVYNNANGTRTSTGPLGKQEIYTYATVQGYPQVSSIARQASPNSPAATQTYTYDSNGYLASVTDFNGNTTTYVHDAHGLETSRTEAFGTALARTVTTSWSTTSACPPRSSSPAGPQPSPTTPTAAC
jgi:YD repeat-containing protein